MVEWGGCMAVSYAGGRFRHLLVLCVVVLTSI